MKKSILMIGLAVLAFPLFAQKNQKQQPMSVKIPMTASAWEFQEGKVEFLDYKGQKAVRLDENSGALFVRNLNFSSGTIEFDVEVNKAQPFPSIYFRQNGDDSELVYLRTGTAVRKNDLDALQYASIVKGVNLWDLQHEFQTTADIKIGEWNHVKIVVSGKQLRVYVNSQTPNLEIPCMEGNVTEGKIGIETGFPGQSVFANLVVKPNETEGLSPNAGPDLTRHDTRYIRSWQVSKPDSLPYGSELNAYMLPKAGDAWETIQAENRGLVNLSRKFGGHSKRNYVWLKAKIKSELAQTQVMRLGFSDEVWVFVNQKPVYLDKNLYLQKMRKSPNGRISLDNSSFPVPLAKGENELLIGVANDFYGWGIIARLEHLEGLEIE